MLISTSDTILLIAIALLFVFIVGSIVESIIGELEWRRFMKENGGKK